MNCAKFKLYHYPATRSARVKWILHEVLGDDFEVEIVHLYDGVQYQADYLAKNPNHCVPTLEVEFADGKSLRMIESAAMIAFIADAFPGKRLAPHAIDEPLARADYLQMLHFSATWMDMMLWQIRSHEHLLPVDQRDLRVAERYRAKFTDEVEPQLLARLGQQTFICGERFNAADCVITHNIMWAKSYGLCAGDIFKRYLVSVHKLPAQSILWATMVFVDSLRDKCHLPLAPFFNDLRHRKMATPPCVAI